MSLRFPAAANNSCMARLLFSPVFLFLTLVLIAPACKAVGPTSCSTHKGQATLNELRIGSSGKSSASNQIEIYNSGNVAEAAWKTWQLVVYQKDNRGRISRKGGYYLSSGFTQNATSSGRFIYNSGKSLFLRNRNGRPVDIALVDNIGALIDYLAVDGRIQTVPACFGAAPVVDATASSNTTGNVSRLPDGGAWPATVTSTSAHTIGRTNVCTLAGNDLVVSSSVDITDPIVNATTVAYTVNVLNKSCSGSVSGIVLTDAGLSSTNFSSINASASTGSTSVSTSALTWNIGSLAAGASATLSVTGKPKVLGGITTTAGITSPGSGLINTGDDSDTETIVVRDYNYVGFELGRDTLTEGTHSAYSATIVSNVKAGKPITVNYSVSGSAGAGDTNLPASGSVIIDPSDDEDPTSASIDFTIIDDAVNEPAKSIVLRITGVTSADANVKLAAAAQEMALTLLDDDPAFIAPTGFNCVESGAHAGAGRLFTKLAGTPFAFDIVAQKSDGTVETTYASTGAKTVTVELVDGAGSVACASRNVLAAWPAQTFTAANAGRITASAAALGSAYANLRCRVSDGSVTGCSSDNFSVRPGTFTLTSGASADAAGASATAAPTVKAGAAFSLNASAVVGYNGTPVLDVGKVQAHAGALATGTLSGSFGAANAVTGIAIGTLTYGEAGYFRLVANGVTDTGFTGVDAAYGDCTADFSNTAVGGKYGCYIGNSVASSYFGRFIPDHFDVSVSAHGSLAPACGGFTYTGQPMTYAIPPALRIKAMNGLSPATVTQNYSGGFQKLTANGVALATPTADAAQSGRDNATRTEMTATLGVGALTNNSGTLTYTLGGSDSFTYTRNADALIGPYTSAIPLAVSAVSDGETSASGALPMLNPTGVPIRFGRLRLGNATGSELRELPVPLTAQYWNGSGFMLNADDHCTALAAPALAFHAQTASNQLASGETVAGFNAALINGDGNLRLTAPGAGNFGYLDLSLPAPAWLQYNWDGVDQDNNGNLFDDNPRARAAFGKRRGADRIIIRREIY